jgi:hypothetical protein
VILTNSLVVPLIVANRRSDPDILVLRALPPEPEPPEEAPMHQTTSRTLCVFFLTGCHSDRLIELWTHLKLHKVLPEIDFDHWFVNCTRGNDTLQRTRIPPDEFREMMALRPANCPWGPDPAAKLWFSLRFFLQRSPCFSAPHIGNRK